MSTRIVFTAEIEVYDIVVAEVDGCAEVSMDGHGDPEIDRITLDGIGNHGMTVTTLPSDHPLYDPIVRWLRKNRAVDLWECARDDRAGRKAYDRALFRTAE